MLWKKTGLCDTSTLVALPGDDGVSTVAEPPLQSLPLDSALPPQEVLADRSHGRSAKTSLTCLPAGCSVVKTKSTRAK